jgi:hypothetical protein
MHFEFCSILRVIHRLNVVTATGFVASVGAGLIMTGLCTHFRHFWAEFSVGIANSSSILRIFFAIT